MSERIFAYTALIVALLCFGPAELWAVPGTVKLETGAVLEGDISLPPGDKIELVLAGTREKASIPVDDIKNIEVAPSSPSASGKPPLLKRLWRRFTASSDAEQTLTVTLRTGEVYTGWLFWHQSTGEVEVRESKYVVRKAYLRPRQIDRDRHHPIDVKRQYVRSITFYEKDTAVSKECPKGERSFDRSDYQFCPFDGTPLTEQKVSAQD